MYSAALTKWYNDAVIKQKELRKDNDQIQAYICQISNVAYGQMPRGISLYIVCRILDWLIIDNSAYMCN